MNVLELMRVGPVIPVIIIDELAQAVPLAEALVAGGVKVLEVTLRTPVAIEAIRAISCRARSNSSRLIPGRILSKSIASPPPDPDF